MRLAQWALIQSYWCLYKKRLGHEHTETMGRHGEKAPLYTLRREASEEASLAHRLILDF